MSPRLIFHVLCCLMLLGGIALTSFYAWSPYSDEQREARTGSGFGARGGGPTHK
ncbi:hypothetical protein EDF56_11453 [Novosphingobium sp. PhB165]|uniref:hypothetical protein n=1 Tax=Novosphingobium sp. PhB165 TaxID=2485105 RepID=UPI0010D96477|nr:hypothetical protein [Novosphingobium sp. PhB165]TCM14219.1 hypothetical protein EDF56_11453 [Novosphingobium sp. PhB165]